MTNGILSGEFSVSDTKKVRFSQGNLQYQASTGTWRFAEHQWDMIGDDNENISPNYDGWIDLFGWGTSGWNSGANAYQPYSTSPDPEDYYPGGSYENDLTGDYANADWGVYNKISNGGNKAGLWRTLTKDEWEYLIEGRENAASKYGVACVNGVNGLVLLPDSWTLPNGLSFTSGEGDIDNKDQAADVYKTVNSYTTSEWARLEAYGAVFLPAAGNRDGSDVYDVGDGNYWSSSASYGSYASYLYFGSFYAGMYLSSHYHGRSVRLVRVL